MDTAPNNYQKYREQGYSQSKAMAMNLQDNINWGVARGVLESAWATTPNPYEQK